MKEKPQTKDIDGTSKNSPLDKIETIIDEIGEAESENIETDY